MKEQEKRPDQKKSISAAHHTESEGENKGLSMMPPPLQFKTMQGEEEYEGEKSPIQKKSNPSGMPEKVQTKMENAFGHDFSDVNIHTNSGSAKDMGALAYTQGNDVHFASGQYNPQSLKGQELIGHELAHVVQQREGRVKPTTQSKGMAVNDDKDLEKEADDMGKKVVQGKSGLSIGSKQFQGKSNIIQKYFDFSLFPIALDSIINGRSEDQISSNNQAHPSFYQKNLPASYRNILWCIYKGMHWNIQFGNTAAFWVNQGLQRINNNLTTIQTEIPTFNLAGYESRLYLIINEPTTEERGTIENNENRNLRTERRRSLGRGGENVNSDEGREELNELISNNGGLVLAFSIPDAHHSQSEVRTQGGVSGYARRRATRENENRTAEEITYTNESVFMTEALAFARSNSCLGIFNNQLKVGIPNVYFEGNDIITKSMDICQRVQEITGRSHTISRIAIFSHGTDDDLRGRTGSRAGRAFVRRENPTQFSINTLVSGLSPILSDDIRIRLFACLTGRRSEGGFADELRDSLHNHGHENALVLGHTIAARATLNRAHRLFISENRYLDVSPTNNRRSLFPNSFIREEIDRLEIRSNRGRRRPRGKGGKRNTLIRDMTNFYCSRSWLINLAEYDMETLTKEQFFQEFREYWRSVIVDYETYMRIDALGSLQL